MEKSIVVIGDLNLDTTVKIDTYPIDKGDTIFCINGVFDHIGGAATNVAVGMRKLGMDIKLCASIGTDRIGDLVIEQVKEYGIDISRVRRDWPLTARTVILVDHTGSRRCLSDPKEVSTYRYPKDDFEAILKKCDMMYVSTQNWTRYIAQQAHEVGKKVAVDVHAVAGIDEYHLDYYKNADVLFFSTERLQIALKDFIDKLWYEYDIPLVVATHGKDGATVANREEGILFRQNSVFIRTVVDTNGAGDSFCAGFLASIADGYSPKDALLRGQITASYKIGQSGSVDGFPSKEQLDKFYWELKG